MPALFLALIVRLIVEIVKAARKHKASKPRPLCTECTHAHVQYAVNGRRAIACTFAGEVRPVQIDVMYCTDYRDRNAVPRLVQIGFARQIGDAEAIAEWRASPIETSQFRKAEPHAAVASLAERPFRALPVHSIGVDRRGWGRTTNDNKKADDRRLTTGD